MTALEPDSWIDVGAAEELAASPCSRRCRAHADRDHLQGGTFGAISGVCNHVGGPLGEGTLDGDYVVCPWHYWKFHCADRPGRAGLRGGRVPRYAVRVENGRVLVQRAAATQARPSSRIRRIRWRARRVRAAGPDARARASRPPR